MAKPNSKWVYEQYLKVQDKYSEIFEDALSFYLAHKKSDERKPFLGTQSTNNTEDQKIF